MSLSRPPPAFAPLPSLAYEQVFRGSSSDIPPPAQLHQLVIENPVQVAAISTAVPAMQESKFSEAKIIARRKKQMSGPDKNLPVNFILR